MLYLVSISMIIILLFSFVAMGRLVIHNCPKYISQIENKIFIEPVLGLSIFILISICYGWINKFNFLITFIIFVVVTLISFFLDNKKRELLLNVYKISIFGLIISLPILGPLIIYDGFNPFNDTYTYLVHGQWLQFHPFSEKIIQSGHFPAESQVSMYQVDGSRMGASFLLAFIQSLFNLKWSYYAYVPTVSLAVICGSLTMGALINRVIKLPQKVLFGLCLLPACSFNGFIFGSQFGFFPQTFGLCFVAILFLLTTEAFECIKSESSQIIYKRKYIINEFKSAIPISLCLSTLLYVYNDLFPAILATLFVYLTIKLIFTLNKLKIIYILISIILITSLLVNIEGIRILRNLIGSVLGAASGNVVFGWPVFWNPLQFYAHSYGFKSSFGNNEFLLDLVTSSYIFPILLFSGIYLIYTHLKNNKFKDSEILLLTLIANILFIFAYLKFRYINVGYSENEIGHTFLQYKLAKWLSVINLPLVGIVIGIIYTSKSILKNLFLYLTVFLMLTGLTIQTFVISKYHTQHFNDEIMSKRSAFDSLIGLRNKLSVLPFNDIIYIGLPHDHHKLAQMIGYILFDKKLAGKYEDGYIRRSIPDNQKDMDIDIADWVIIYKPIKSHNENPMYRTGPFYIIKKPFKYFTNDKILSEYRTESNESEQWNWVNEKIEFKYSNIGKCNKSLFSFDLLINGNSTKLTMVEKSYDGSKVLSTKEFDASSSVKNKTITYINNINSFSLEIKANGDAIQLSAGDKRLAKFMIKNFSLECIDSNS